MSDSNKPIEYKPGQELSSIDFHSMIGGPLSAIVDAQAQAAMSSVNFIKSVGFTPDVTNENGTITPGSPVYVNFKYPKMVAPYQASVEGIVSVLNKDKEGKDYPDGTVSLIFSGEGSGASGTATVAGGKVTKVRLINGGSGYSNDTTLSISSDTGSGFEGTVTTKKAASVPAVFQEMQLEVPILTMLPIPFIRVDEATIDFHAKITSMSYADVASKFKTSTRTDDKSRRSGNNSTSTGFLTSIFLNADVNSRYSSSARLRTNVSFQKTTKAGGKIDKVFQLGVKVKVSQDEMPEGMEKLLGILEDAIVSQPVEN